MTLAFSPIHSSVLSAQEGKCKLSVIYPLQLLVIYLKSSWNVIKMVIVSFLNCKVYFRLLENESNLNWFFLVVFFFFFLRLFFSNVASLLLLQKCLCLMRLNHPQIKKAKVKKHSAPKLWMTRTSDGVQQASGSNSTIKQVINNIQIKQPWT